MAEMLWAGFKAIFTVTAILCVMLALNISHSPKLLVAWPVLLGAGITFSCIALIFNALAQGYDFFTYYFTLFLTPMMFLSGVFFPREQLPAAGALVSDWLPLTNAVELVRPMFMDQLAGAPGCAPAGARRPTRSARSGSRWRSRAGASRPSAAMAVPLPPDLVAMMARGVSVIVASHDAALRPNLMRAVGSRIEGDGAITVYLARRQSRQVVQDLAATGHIAVVFSEPSTHRSVQLKATRVEMRSAEAQDTPVLERYRQPWNGKSSRSGSRRRSPAPCWRIGSTISWPCGSRRNRPLTRRPDRARARPLGGTP